jgi:regulator of protease activity HflC (stomatin/prohibitin superfamily)
MTFTILICLIIAIVTLFACVQVVREQNVAIVETFGKYATSLEPGLHFILPRPFSAVVHVADLRIQEIKTNIEIKTRDNVFVHMPATLMLKISADHVAESYYKLGNPQEQISRWVLNTVRGAAANMSLEELFTDRDRIVNEVKKDLEKKTLDYGYRIEGVLVEQPSVSEELQRVFNRVVASHREQEAATQEGEAARIRTVASARAEAEGQIERAKGLAQSREILAKSLRENIEAITESGADTSAAMELLISVNRLDAIRHVGESGNLILMDVNDPQRAIQAALLKNIEVEPKITPARQAAIITVPPV